MQPAVVILLAGRWLANKMGDFGDARTSRLQSEREDWCPSRLKRPHSRRNPWQPERDHFKPTSSAIKQRSIKKVVAPTGTTTQVKLICYQNQALL